MADQPPIIIKKIKKSAHAHHGGAWKVAYADFVTAMMAFFLLLWLLNVTTDIQRKGIADYFAPASISKSESGAAGIFGGRIMSAPEAKFSDSAPPGIENAEPLPPGYETDKPEDTSEKTRVAESAQKKQGTDGKLNEAAIDKALAAREVAEKAALKEAGEALKQVVVETPELTALAKSLIIDQTDEGLRIQIVDQANYSMFPSASAQMYPQTRTLLETIGRAIGQLPNKLVVTGHTDSTPFAATSQRDNWDLSAERANASRRALEAIGIAPDRFQNIVGRADRDPLVKEDPKDPKNRRISIVLLRDSSATVASEPAPEQAPANEQ